ncbi:hypothetical protein ACMU_02040 [Actibacterium mucosum KCTC 23349]|uniref:Glycine zipper domain-containing protein n=1 Tax=Actibacterium mucosum KCTC 23349 TaxID=1454373 RepID=A0A037ZR20_9RHOB|nr:hypothetical protein [Actibacterium mucosum]KAJ57302.1 hypothetical protein ACMU_02040 [Actibacterium mucosum KCTC 23349]
MKPLILSAAILTMLAGCDTTEQSAATGALLGAAVGAATAGQNEGKGAALGAALGAVAGVAAHGAAQGPECRYTYPDGRVTYAPCPQ